MGNTHGISHNNQISQVAANKENLNILISLFRHPVSLKHQESSTMQTAMILSDLKSLSVCGHEEALNLVSVHKTISTSIKESSGHLELGAAPEAFDETHPEQPDLQRATDLVGLHHSVKLKHLEGGLDAELQNGRKNVKRVLKDLNSKSRA